MAPGPQPIPVPERFWPKVDKDGPLLNPTLGACWIWTASRSPFGHGQFYVRHGVPRRAHRIAYEMLVGPIPEGLVLDHLCRNPPCVNPAHLEPVTQRINTQRAPRGGTAAQYAARTYCPQGHPLIGDNLVRRSGGRVCLACRRRYLRDYMRGRRGTSPANYRVERRQGITAQVPQ